MRNQHCTESVPWWVGRIDAYREDAEEIQKNVLRIGELISRMDIQGFVMGVVRDRAKAYQEIDRLKAALNHIADTCPDPDTAQFAARVQDGSAQVPGMIRPMKELAAVGRDESCHNCGEAREDGSCDHFTNCTLELSRWKPKP